jgi:hypothetical protein
MGEICNKFNMISIEQLQLSSEPIIDVDKSIQTIIDPSSSLLRHHEYHSLLIDLMK